MQTFNCYFMISVMLQGNVTVHAFSPIWAAIQYQGTRCAVHTSWRGWDEYVLTFSLTDVFMITFHPILIPPISLWFLNICTVSICLGTCFLWIRQMQCNMFYKIKAIRASALQCVCVCVCTMVVKLVKKNGSHHRHYLYSTLGASWKLPINQHLIKALLVLSRRKGQSTLRRSEQTLSCPQSTMSSGWISTLNANALDVVLRVVKSWVIQGTTLKDVNMCEMPLTPLRKNEAKVSEIHAIPFTGGNIFWSQSLQIRQWFNSRPNS